MLDVTPRQLKALQAACNALIPTIEKGTGDLAAYYEANASNTQVAEQMIDVIGSLREGEQKEFIQLLGILDSKLAGMIFAGSWTAFADLPFEKQVAVLQKWMRSRLNVLRKAFQTLKKLSMFFHYGHSEPDQQNPSWPALGYPGPLNSPPGEKLKIQPWIATKDQSLSADVIVVGSGAAGGIAAGMLAEAGKSVILVEKGPMMSGSDFDQREVAMIRKTYDGQGALVTKDGSTTVFAGSCLGGGTTINWTGSFPTPDYVLEEWHRNHGLEFATSAEYRESLEAVMGSVSVNKEHSPHNPQNAALWRGSEKLGQDVQVIARNVEGCDVDGCQSCGYCGLGCRRGAKRGTARTWIERAAAAGARILVGTEVERVLLDRGRTAGVDAVQWTDAGGRFQLKLKAPQVIMAAGSVHTPAVLMRSGLSHPHLGRHLYFHPTLAVSGFYEEEIAPWYGVMMSAINKSGMHMDGNYGYWIETPPLHTGVAALALPWENPVQHKDDLLRAGNMASFIVLTRDKFGGRVTVDKQGKAVTHYPLHPYDRQHMQQGIADAFRIHAAAGAKEVIFPHHRRHVYDLQKTKISANDFLKHMPSWGWRRNQFPLFTAHQMGTCAIGDDPGRHPVQPDGQFRGIPGLYVVDGSVLPSSAGVNPMVSIMAMGHWLSRQWV